MYIPKEEQDLTKAKRDSELHNQHVPRYIPLRLSWKLEYVVKDLDNRKLKSQRNATPSAPN
jgi:hypothetical protein